jgi:RNA polymerase-binding transcription factor DksA
MSIAKSAKRLTAPANARRATVAPAKAASTRATMRTKAAVAAKKAPAKKAAPARKAAPAPKKANAAAKKAAPPAKKKAPPAKTGVAKRPAPTPAPPAKKAAPAAKKAAAAAAKKPSSATAKKAPPAAATTAPAAPSKATAATKAPPAAKKPAAAAPAKPSFDAKFLEEQRTTLLEERAKYLRSAQILKAEADALVLEREPGDVQFDEESGEGDTLAVERDFDLALSAQARGQVDEIDAALARLEAGTYGICRVSGLPIPKERLRAIPWATERVEYKVGGLGRR